MGVELIPVLGNHDPQGARRVADRIVRMGAGRVVDSGPPGAVLPA